LIKKRFVLNAINAEPMPNEKLNGFIKTIGLRLILNAVVAATALPADWPLKSIMTALLQRGLFCP